MGSMAAFVDELVKIAAGAEVGSAILKRLAKPAALVGGGALAYHYGKKELDKTIQGRRMYEQVMAQQGQ